MNITYVQKIEWLDIILQHLVAYSEKEGDDRMVVCHQAMVRSIVEDLDRLQDLLD